MSRDFVDEARMSVEAAASTLAVSYERFIALVSTESPDRERKLVGAVYQGMRDLNHYAAMEEAYKQKRLEKIREGMRPGVPAA